MVGNIIDSLDFNIKLLIMSQVIYTSFYIFNSLLVHKLGVSSGRIKVFYQSNQSFYWFNRRFYQIRVSTLYVCAILVLRDV